MPLPIANFIALVSSILPLCCNLPFLATLYGCLSDRKSFSDNPFLSSLSLHRRLVLPFRLSCL
ncbi:MAG: hypothetical protein NZ805_02665, partial [Armatimonadetes bacterium]|nr:hypothetical protein [Armatimonadota bacterium]